MKKKKPRCALTQQGFGEVNKGLPNHLNTHVLADVKS